MKYREKGPIEYVVREKETKKKFTFQFKFIDYVPRLSAEVGCCSFCPLEDMCDSFPDPRDLNSPNDFNNFCADMDDELGDGKWTPIPVPSTVEKWLDEIKKERSSRD